MTDQIRIGDNGETCVICHLPLDDHWLASCPDQPEPTTWDGEPLYSPTTVQEGLFASEAFKQMPGQTSMSTDELPVEPMPSTYRWAP